MPTPKPNGLFQYNILALAGGGGATTIDLFATPDVWGNIVTTFPALPGTNSPFLTLSFQPTTHANGGRAGNVEYFRNSTATNGYITALSVTVANFSAGAGDTVTGILNVLILNLANQGL
ncbi:MAG: hypothetical protein JO086_00025 [Acidimicrobiia bacterium]|nr:hypothetical protein [Acidimicrobiia bacterium]